MALCHFAASNLSSGHDVLYITMEMAEERIAERIYANLMDIPIGQLSDLPKQDFKRKINQIEQKTQGRLVIKEYPTASAHSGHFEALLQELRTKRNFIPGIIYIDYLNICSSRNVKFSYGANTYVIVKAIAEELRAIGQKHNLPIVTATQTTRSGFTSSDPGLEDTSESFGLPATADFMVSMIRTDDLDALNQVQFKQLKNRYGNQNLYKRFVVGFDMDKMRLYNVEQNAQDDIIDDSIPIMDEKWSPPNRSELFKEFK
jgi:replicative DNA helicase